MLQAYYMRTIIKMIKNTHRHPANRALHFVGAPFYVIGAMMTVEHLAGMHTDIFTGVTMWILALTMFVSGHKIENNIRSMTPVLLFMLLLKIAHNVIAQRIHFLRA